MSKIEQVISDIEGFIDECKTAPLSGGSKIIVNKDELDDLLAELRMRTPDEIKKYQKIINNKDAILNDAKQKAEQIIQQAKAQSEQMISEHEIMQQAYDQANDMMQQTSNDAQNLLDNAVNEANAVRSAAMNYTDDELANLEKLMTNIMNDVSAKYEQFMGSLNAGLEIVQANRAQLKPAEEEYYEEQPEEEQLPEDDVLAEDETTEFEDYTVDLDDEF